MQGSGTFSLAMVQGPQPGQIFELPHSTISIGRDPGNHVMIDDAQVSRQHARIVPQGGLMVLEDLGSTNGTTVNGLRISSPHTLAHGDEIGLGDNVTLTFYGQPISSAGETTVAPRAVYDVPAQPTPAYPPPAYDAAAGYQPPADYGAAQPVEPEYGDEPEYYEDYYEDDGGYNMALIGGCLLVAVIALLLLAVFIYFFAPASIVDPIYDFLVGLGITVP
jgi:pSer/pThr/pTyr-binding forkhead associated (FHA) protein